MDLSLYLRVVWRFRVLAALGLVLAVMLGLLSYLKVDLADGSFDISYRDSEQWSSSATIFVTQLGFPLGRSIYDETVPVRPAPGAETSYVPRYADPSRFASYAQLFARVAASDLLRRRMLQAGPLRGTVRASAATDSRNVDFVLPLVEIQGLAETAPDARATSARATRALIEYVEQEQAANKIALNRRVILRVLDDPSKPSLVAPRSKTRPAFIFVAVLLAVSALIFILENLRPRLRAVPSDENDLAVSGDSRRTA